MTRLIHHLRSNAIAYLALIVALGGTSYAATNLPANSVGTRQLKSGAVTTNKLANGSVTAKKLDSKSIGGSVLHWALHRRRTASPRAASRDARVSVSADAVHRRLGDRGFRTRARSWRRSAAVPGIRTDRGSPRNRMSMQSAPAGQTRVCVWPYDEAGPARARFNIAVIC